MIRLFIMPSTPTIAPGNSVNEGMEPRSSDTRDSFSSCV